MRRTRYSINSHSNRRVHTYTCRLAPPSVGVVLEQEHVRHAFIYVVRREDDNGNGGRFVAALCMPCFADFRFLCQLVCITGVMYFTNMKNLHEDEWERTVDVNCKGTMFGIGAVLGGMVERGSGHIVNISSDAGRRIFPSLAVYCASKYFVEAMSEGLRRELVGTGLRVTTIQPGDCATDLVMNNTDKEAAEEQGVTIGVKVGTGSTENQVLQPKDIAAAVLYAVSAPSHVAINEVLVEPRDQA